MLIKNKIVEAIFTPVVLYSHLNGLMNIISIVKINIKINQINA